MKKKNWIYIVIIILVFILSACGEKSAEETAIETAPSQETEVASAPTPESAIDEPTAAPATPTADADPFSKISLSPADMDTLINLWTISEIPVSEQGQLDELNISFANGFINLNYYFTTQSSEDDLKSLYSTVIPGEWEKDEYAAGPVLEGWTENGERLLCQIINEGNENDLSVFISSENTEVFEEFTNLFNEKWPIGLIPENEKVTDDNLNQINLSFSNEQMSIILSKNYAANSARAEIIEYYKSTLADYSDYAVFEDYSGNEYVICSNSGIQIAIRYEEFWDYIVIEYTVPIQ